METKTRLGRMRSGGSQSKLMLTSAAAGAMTAVIVGAVLTTLTDHTGVSAGLAVVIYAACLFPVGFVAWWAVLVDRSTIAGAPAQPEESIESRWYDQAAQSTFHVCLWAVGALGVVSVFWDFQVSAYWLTIGLGTFLAVVFWVSYLLHKRRES